MRDIAGKPPNLMWRGLKGTLAAAWAHLARIGASWPAPFKLRLLEHDVNVLEVSPRHVMAAVGPTPGAITTTNSSGA